MAGCFHTNYSHTAHPLIMVRCHGDLNDFVPVRRRGQAQLVPFQPHATAKGIVESLGVPHPEIATLLVDGVAVDFGHQLSEGSTLDVYPASVTPPVPGLILRPPLEHEHFVLDTHLGRLAASLRMLGYDAWYCNQADDALLAQLSAAEGRVLLTRDLGLLKRACVVYGAFVRATNPNQQLVEIMRRFAFIQDTRAFSRCVRCNGLLAAVAKDHVTAQLKPATRHGHDTFFQCQACSQVYWAGSHVTRMRQRLDAALREARGTG